MWSSGMFIPLKSGTWVDRLVNRSDLPPILTRMRIMRFCYHVQSVLPRYTFKLYTDGCIVQKICFIAPVYLELERCRRGI